MERKELLVIVLIGVLLLVVGLQTMQISGLTKAQVVTTANPTTTGPAVSTVKSPSTQTNSLQNLPSMVGGC